MSQLKSVQEIINAVHDEDVSVIVPVFSYNNIATSAQTLVKTGVGMLGIVAINSTLTSAVRGYDNTVSGGSTLFTIPAGTAPTSIRYDLKFNTGLVVSSGAGADNLTIMYK